MKFGETWWLEDGRAGIWVDRHPHGKSARCNLDWEHIVQAKDARAWIEDPHGVTTIASKRTPPRIYVCVLCAMTAGAPPPPTEPPDTGRLFDEE